MSNQLANELHKPIIRKFKRHEVYSISGQAGGDLADT